MKTCSRCGVSKEETCFSPKQTHCKKCCAEKRAIWRANNPQAMAEENAAYRAKNPGYSKAHYANNLEREAKRKAEYYLQNKEKVRTRIDSYSARKPHVRTAITAKRRAKLLQATPAWADFEKIKEFYAYAKTMSSPHEVDHIVPLQGKNVCGLHWEGNLQVIPKSDNRKKSSKLIDA